MADVRNVERRSSMTKNCTSIICLPVHKEGRTATATWCWFICSAISKSMLSRNGPCETANSSMTKNWQKKAAARNDESGKRKRSRVVRDVLEPDVLRGTSPVLRGLRGSNAPWLPDRKPYGWLKPAASRLHKSPASWVFPIPRFISGVRSWQSTALKRSQGKGTKPSSKRENRRLKRENELLRQERDILKKAVGIFSRESR